MPDLVWLIPVLPLAGFLTLALLGGRLKAGVIAAVGCAGVGLSMTASLMLLAGFIHAPSPGIITYSRTLWTWFTAGGRAPGIGF